MGLNIDKFKNVLQAGNIEEDEIYLFMDYRDLCKELQQYTPTEHESAIITKLTGLSDEWLKESEIKLLCDGNISVRTSKGTWMALMGREYLVDIDKEEAYLICLN